MVHRIVLPSTQSYIHNLTVVNIRKIHSIPFHSENNWNEIFPHTHTDTNACSHSTHVGIVSSLAQMNAKMEFVVDVCACCSPSHFRCSNITYDTWYMMMLSVFRFACVPHIAATKCCMHRIWLRSVFIHKDSWWRRRRWWLNVCSASEMHAKWIGLEEWVKY